MTGPPGQHAGNPSVEDWFARRTFRVADYAVEDLVARRTRQSVTVSCVLPARNEVATVGGVVAAAVALQPHLVDEVIVVDAGSTDGTADAAARAGARVVVDDSLPPGPPCRGKGDALWRSLGAVDGDLVVFVDTDIRNPSPSFVVGLLGPLLTHADVHFVKAFYDRPIELDGVTAASGGGRVTELTARPLLNLYWPHLSGLAQPLSGEYAGRRTALEQVPFFTGYGVEFGLVVDLADAFGSDAIAQVDLGRRVHRNQSLPALSRMAMGINLVARRRAEQPDDAPDSGTTSARYHQVQRSADGTARLTASTVEVHERPPRRGHGPRATHRPEAAPGQVR